MKEKNKLYINIPTPCKEKWEQMDAAGGGRYCLKCNNVVVDFTQMSDDELLKYFSLLSPVHCGRFGSYQLDRFIEPKKKRLFDNFILKRIFALAAISAAMVKIKAAQTSCAIARDISLIRTQSETMIDSLIITGTVSDFDSKGIVGAKISSSVAGEVFTDTSGSFIIALQADKNVPQTFIFSFGDKIPVARSFHPSMGSTSYQVVLSSKSEIAGSNGFMGILSPLAIPSASIRFEAKSSNLSETAQHTLFDVADKLKNNPAFIIKVTLNGIKGNTSLVNKRFSTIKQQLVNDYRISPDRILQSKTYNIKEVNTVVINFEF